MRISDWSSDVCSSDLAHEHPEKLHTVGRPAPGNLLKVLGENFQEVAPGEIGELVGKSSVVMLGYKNRPDKSSENYWIDPRDGSTWLRTGDVGSTEERRVGKECVSK